MRELSPERHALLVEIMRQRVDKIDAEVARLCRERDEVVAWLQKHDPETSDRRDPTSAGVVATPGDPAGESRARSGGPGTTAGDDTTGGGRD